MAKKVTRAPKAMTEAQALVMIAKALDRIADAAEIMASPPQREVEPGPDAEQQHNE